MTTRLNGPRASSKKTRIETPVDRIGDLPTKPRPRASSKKTRIETAVVLSRFPGLGCPRASSKKTRIETRFRRAGRHGGPVSEGKFQENKD